jgi:thiol-disulfide isomerase/thioredoxin
MRINQRKLAIVISVFVMLLVAGFSSARADVVQMKQALELLSSGKYQQAATILTQEVKASPTNEQARYCLAVCQHFLGKYPEAGAGYTWVCKNSKDPDLVRRAQKGLNGISKFVAVKNSGTSAGNPSWMAADTPPGGNMWTGVRPGTATGLSAMAPTSDAAGYNVPAPAVTADTAEQDGNGNGAQPVIAQSSTSGARIVDVYTEWCGWCKKFKPIFHEAAGKYASSGISFDSLDAEAPENKSFVEKHRSDITGYPTVLFLDGNDTVLQAIHGCPKTVESFEQRIWKVWPQLKR